MFIYRHGKQGVLNTASNSQLENEFGTKNEDDVVKQILEKGDIQSSEVCLSTLAFALRHDADCQRRTPSARVTPTTPRAPCWPIKSVPFSRLRRMMLGLEYGCWLIRGLKDFG